MPYGKIGGDLSANNFHALTRQNPFYAPSDLGLESPDQGFRSTNKRLALAGAFGVRSQKPSDSMDTSALRATKTMPCSALLLPRWIQ